MARHYSTRDFFRQMPNVLLARYFAARAVFGEFISPPCPRLGTTNCLPPGWPCQKPSATPWMPSFATSLN